MSEHTENLTIQPVAKLHARTSFHAILILLISALYNIADTYFVTLGVGLLAFGGVSIALPLLLATHSVPLLIATGSASIISRCLGAKIGLAAAGIDG